jgi:AcrR family transcriptional regulator
MAAIVAAVPATTASERVEPRQSYANGRARRESIIRTASAYFAERGFLNATILEIAAACGISRAGLLHHFPTKDALLEAVLQARDEEDRARFAPYAQGAGAIGVLRGMVELAEHNRLVPGLIELFVRLSAEAVAPDHPAHGYVVERYARIRSDTARTVRAAVRDGHLRAGIDPEDAALRLTALMDGLQSQWLVDRSIDLAEPLRRTLDEWMTDAGRAAFQELGR